MVDIQSLIDYNFYKGRYDSMINKTLLEKYAELAVRVGVNVQKGQLVFVNASTDNNVLAREIVKQAYLVGASKVVVNWSDDYTTKLGYEYRKMESLSSIPDYYIEKYKDFIEKDGCSISIKSPVPNLNKDIDPKKLQAAGIATRKALSFYYDHMMASISLPW